MLALNRSLIVFVVSFVAFLGPFSQSIYAPILPEVAQHFASPQLLVNFSLSIYTFTLAIMQIVYGPLTDALGRRKVLLPGILLYVLATIGCSYATTIEQFLLFRGLQAAGIASGSVIAVTVIGDLCKGAALGRAMGTYQMLVSLGPVLGPVLGGVIWGVVGYHGLVTFLICMGVLVLLANVAFTKETKALQDASNRFRLAVVKEILRHPIGMSIILLGFIQYYTFFTFLVFFPQILVERYGLTVAQKGLAFLPLSCCIVIGSFFGGKLMEKINIFRYMIGTTSLNVVVIVLSIVSAELSFVLVVLCSALFGLFLGLSLPVQTTLLSRTFSQERATSVGIYNFFRFFGIAISPMVGGVLYQWGEGPLLFGFVSVVFAFAVWFMKRNFTQAEKAQLPETNHVSV